ncbi:MAG: hypothetical protein DDT20_00868 [Firmicutes bacterium]|nr:hypothetical protein [Bacillota bacterium]MBT9176548.1 hypothetical protein [Bacillota bacterium]
MKLPDHPVIRNMERTGYPDGKEPKQPICPICSRKADTFYVGERGDILGCEECVCARDAWEI